MRKPTKVEKFKITKEQQLISKKMRTFNKIQKLLQKQGLRHMGALQGIKDIFGELQTGKQELMLKAPKQPTIEMDQEIY